MLGGIQSQWLELGSLGDHEEEAHVKSGQKKELWLMVLQLPHPLWALEGDFCKGQVNSLS